MEQLLALEMVRVTEAAALASALTHVQVRSRGCSLAPCAGLG